MRHRHRSPDASMPLAVILIAAFLVALLISVVLTAPAHAAQSGCSKYRDGYLKARCVVYAVFPDSTQDAALRVVGCETGFTYTMWSYNSSGATGYFQILQGNAGRLLRYDKSWPGGDKHGGHLLIIPSGAKLFQPWTNAKVALFLSHGGTDFGEWTCKP